MTDREKELLDVTNSLIIDVHNSIKEMGCNREETCFIFAHVGQSLVLDSIRNTKKLSVRKNIFNSVKNNILDNCDFGKTDNVLNIIDGEKK
jgi:hypothetical protein